MKRYRVGALILLLALLAAWTAFGETAEERAQSETGSAFTITGGGQGNAAQPTATPPDTTQPDATQTAGADPAATATVDPELPTGDDAPAEETTPPLTDGPVEIYYVVNPGLGDRLHMRSEPSSQSESQGTYYSGTIVEVLNYNAEFSQVRIGAQEGYMQSTYLNQAQQGYAQATWRTVNVEKGSSLHLRTQPSTTAVSLGTFGNGTVVQVIGEPNETQVAEGGEGAADYLWVRLALQEGYMNGTLLIEDNSTEKPALTTLRYGKLTRASELRSFPDAEGAPMGTYETGTMVDVLGLAGVWYYVRIQSDVAEQQQLGFIYSNDLHVGDYGSSPSERTTPYGVVQCPNPGDRLLLLSNDPAVTEPLGQFFSTTQVELLGDYVKTESTENWRVRINGQEGYMRSAYMDVIDPKSPANWE